MPNPTGKTQFVQEPPYGAVKQLEQLQKSAVLAGSAGASSALNTPTRSKRNAAKGRRITPGQSGPQHQAGAQPVQTGITGPPGVPEGQPAQPQTQELPYNVRLYAAWAEIAATPGVSEIAQIMAERAREKMDAEVR